MGKKKLLAMIAGIVAINSGDVNMKAKMRTFLTGGAKATAQAAEKMSLDEFKDIANNIFNEYHQKIPSVRVLKTRVERAVRIRGWLKNYCGRIYTIPPQMCYKGVNLLIQGSAADIFKERLLECMRTLPELKLITNVHDSVFFSCPEELANEMAKKLQNVMEDVPEVRVPLRFELKAAVKNWGTCGSCKDPKDIGKTLEISKTKTSREWGKEA
jgi:DNA polymerase I-like protein with 3'-5' exonuclease and polymerase domains